MSQGNLEGLLNCSLEKLKGLVDVNTIIGEPITAPDGTIIVPVSKSGVWLWFRRQRFWRGQAEGSVWRRLWCGCFYSAVSLFGDSGRKCTGCFKCRIMIIRQTGQ